VAIVFQALTLTDRRRQRSKCRENEVYVMSCQQAAVQIHIKLASKSFENLAKWE
jgi:hypothetical protein